MIFFKPAWKQKWDFFQARCQTLQESDVCVVSEEVQIKFCVAVLHFSTQAYICTHLNVFVFVALFACAGRFRADVFSH